MFVLLNIKCGLSKLKRSFWIYRSQNVEARQFLNFFFFQEKIRQSHCFSTRYSETQETVE